MKTYITIKKLIHSTAGCLCIIAASCDSKKVEVKTDVTEEPEIIWDWGKFPQASELKLRILPVVIQPKQSFEIKSENNGIITMLPTEKNSAVKKGEIIAKMDVETLAEQKERLRLLEEKQILDELKAEKLTIPEKKKKAKEELAEAKRKLKLLKLVINNPAMTKMSKELGIGAVDKSSMIEAEDNLRFAERKLEWAEKFDEQLRQGEIRLNEMDMTHSKRQYQEIKDRSVYTAPFTGELRLEVNYIQGQNEYTVNARETIATLNDYDEIHAHVKAENAKWITLQPERLFIQLNNKSSTLMTFLEDRIDKDKRTRQEMRKYIFQVPLKNNEELKRLAGSNMQAQLIYKLPKSCYIVPKYDLSLYAYNKTTSIDWTKMIKELWPNATLIAEGRTHIAIELK